MINAYREIRDGWGHITLTLHPSVLTELLSKADVLTAFELPESIWRKYCHTMSGAGILAQISVQEATAPGNSMLAIVKKDGDTSTMRPGDVGQELFSRLTPDIDGSVGALFNPDINPVEMEVWILDEFPDSESTTPENVMSTYLLSLTLNPPNPA